MSRKRAHTKRTGVVYEGLTARDEEEAVIFAKAHNACVRYGRRDAKEAAKKAEIMAKITLPKLKFPGQ